MDLWKVYAKCFVSVSVQWKVLLVLILLKEEHVHIVCPLWSFENICFGPPPIQFEAIKWIVRYESLAMFGVLELW